MNALRLTEVHKSYDGKAALGGLTFSVPRGAICGLVGPNGCGKTTTMGVIGGLLQVQSGSVEVLQETELSGARLAGRVSLMPQDATPQQDQSLRGLLRYYSELQGVAVKDVPAEVSRRLQQVGLADRAGSSFRQLSHGMRRRFSIAQALLGQPELILLDEPSSGLDPELVVQIRELLAEYRGQATLLVSSHILSELESLCDYVVFMEAGRCTRFGSMTEVTGNQAVIRYRLSTRPDLARLEKLLPECALAWAAPTLTIRVASSRSVEDINAHCLKELLTQEIGIAEIATGDTLEASYLRSRAL